MNTSIVYHSPVTQRQGNTPNLLTYITNQQVRYRADYTVAYLICRNDFTSASLRETKGSCFLPSGQSSGLNLNCTHHRLIPRFLPVEYTLCVGVGIGLVGGWMCRCVKLIVIPHTSIPAHHTHSHFTTSHLPLPNFPTFHTSPPLHVAAPPT